LQVDFVSLYDLLQVQNDPVGLVLVLEVVAVEQVLPLFEAHEVVLVAIYLQKERVALRKRDSLVQLRYEHRKLELRKLTVLVRVVLREDVVDVDALGLNNLLDAGYQLLDFLVDDDLRLLLRPRVALQQRVRKDLVPANALALVQDQAFYDKILCLGTNLLIEGKLQRHALDVLNVGIGVSTRPWTWDC